MELHDSTAAQQPDAVTVVQVILRQSLTETDAKGEPMTHEDKGHFEIEDRGAVLIVRVDGGPHALFGPEIANQLEELVDRPDVSMADEPLGMRPSDDDGMDV